MDRREINESPVQSSDTLEARGARHKTLGKKLFAVGASVALAGSLAACGGDSSETPTSTSAPTVEAPVVPGETPAPVETSEPAPTSEPTVETKPTVGNLEFRESDLTPEVLASLSDAEIIERLQIPIAEFPTVEDWAEQYVLRSNDIMRSGTAPSEIDMMYNEGSEAMYANVDHYAELSGQALTTGVEQYKASDVLRLAVLNATQAHEKGETYIIREDLESVELTDGSVEDGAFSVNLTLRRQDNMADLEITKNMILENTGNMLRTLSADVDIHMNIDVVNLGGYWKTKEVSVVSSTPHEK